MRGLFFNKISDAEAEIQIYDQIGMDFWTGEGITAKQFASDLKKLGPVQAINLKINSPGGDVFDGLTIYNELKDHPAKVNVRVMGIAASIASVIAMVGDSIEIQESAQFMIHKAWSISIGNSDDMAKMAETLNSIDESLVTTYAARTKAKASDIRDWMGNETWMTAKLAVERGFADWMIPAKEKVENKFKMLATFKNAPRPEKAHENVAYLRDRLSLLTLRSA